MPASTNLIADITSVITNGPSSVTTANAIAPAGPITDYPGMTKSILLHFQEALVLLGGADQDGIKQDVNGSDPNLSLINGVISALTGGGSPSAHVITDMATIISNGFNAASLANAIAAAGPIIDLLGSSGLVRNKFREAAFMLGSSSAGNDGIIYLTDSSTDSTNLTLLENILLTLS